jgi:hypothetical protein
VTLAGIYLLGSTPLTPAVLLIFWYFLFRPWHPAEVIMVAIAALFFLIQNYLVLQRGGFSFRDRDLLLMPYYEPLLWGFYYLTLKRLIGESSPPPLGWPAAFGLAVTGVCFSLFSGDSSALFSATLLSTGLLLLLFHQRYDLAYALAALAMGLLVELFGVTAGLWRYPQPDILGIPWWFATMWLSVGLLGRRLLIPLALRLHEFSRRTGFGTDSP